MKYFYSDIDGVRLSYGDIQPYGNMDCVPVYFERDDGEGDFDFAEGSVPYCAFTRSRGFSEQELEELRTYLRNNTMLLFDLARQGV